MGSIESFAKAFCKEGPTYQANSEHGVCAMYEKGKQRDNGLHAKDEKDQQRELDD